MYIIFNKRDGSIRESQTDDYVNRGSDGVNFIDVVIYDDEKGACLSPDAYTASGAFLLPDGATSLTATAVLNNSITTSLGVFMGYRFYLYEAFTQYAGDLTFSLVAMQGTATLVTYKQTFVVNETAMHKGTSITWEEYEALMATIKDYQLQFSPSNVRGYSSYEEAVADLENLAVGQYAVVGEDAYSVTEADGTKVLTSLPLGRTALKDYFVFKTHGDGLQNVFTGLTSYYENANGDTVNYGTAGGETESMGFFAHALDANSTPAGKIGLTAKNYKFLGKDNGTIFSSADGTTKVSNSSETASLELSTGQADLKGDADDIESETGAVTIKAHTINVNGLETHFLGEVYFDYSIRPVEFNGGLTVMKNTNPTSIYSEGAVQGLYVGGSETFVSDPTGKSKAVFTSAKCEITAPSVTVSQDPEEDAEVATKHYVDYAIATGGEFKLNIENGTGEGSLQTRDASTAEGAYSYALGKGIINGTAYSLAVGRDFTMSSGDLFAVGADSAIFGIGPSEAYYTGERFTVGGVSRFDGDATFKSDLVVEGRLTATKFSAIQTTSLNTERTTIGLAEGNTEPISTFIGIYATKYDGVNNGALAFDATGTAYVGDAVVDKDGKILNTSNTLQPLLTRTDVTLLPDGCVFAWDASKLQARAFPYLSEVDNGVRLASGDVKLDVLSTGVETSNLSVASAFSADSTGAHSNVYATSDNDLVNKKYVDDNAGSPIILRVW